MIEPVPVPATPAATLVLVRDRRIAEQADLWAFGAAHTGMAEEPAAVP